MSSFYINKDGDYIYDKVCSKCKENKKLDEFSRLKNNKKDGRQSLCKKCAYEEFKIFRKNNKDRVMQSVRKWDLKNKEKMKQKKIQKLKEKNPNYSPRVKIPDDDYNPFLEL